MKFTKFTMILIAMLAIVALAGSGYAETSRLGEKTINFNVSKSVTKTAAYTVTTSDSLVNVTASNADIVITLPSVANSTVAGTKSFKILKTDATAYAITVTPASGDTIGFESTRKLLSANAYMVIHSGPGRNWSVDYETPYIVEDHAAGTYTTGIGSGGLFSTVTSSATTTLTASSCGNVISYSTGTTTVGLPATIANCKLTFIKGSGGGYPLTISPNSADAIVGSTHSTSTVVAFSGADYTSIINVATTSVKGDWITLIGDGVTGWVVVGNQGIWANQ